MSLMKYINRTARLASDYRAKEFIDLGIDAHHHKYILNICRSPGITSEELSKNILVNKSTITRQVNDLVDRGYIQRVPSKADRRVINLFPTDKAFEIYPSVVGILESWNRELLSCLDENDVSTLLSLMERVMKKALSMSERNYKYD